MAAAFGTFGEVAGAFWAANPRKGVVGCEFSITHPSVLRVGNIRNGSIADVSNLLQSLRPRTVVGGRLAVGPLVSAGFLHDVVLDLAQRLEELLAV